MLIMMVKTGREVQIDGFKNSGKILLIMRC